MNDEKPELVFDDLTLERTFRPLEFPLSPERIQDYMDTVGDRHPWYWDEARGDSFDGLLAPPGLAAVFARLSYLQDHSMPSGGVLAKQEFEFHAPMRRHDVLTVQARVFERYLDEKGRRRVNFRIEAVDQTGRSVCLIRLYAIWPK